MMDFPPSKKMELIEQNDAVQRMRVSSTPTPMASHQSTPLPRPRSITSTLMASANSADVPGSAAQASLEQLLNSGRSPPKGGGSLTGFLFGNLFANTTNHPEGSVEYYLWRLNSKNILPQEMFKCLQSLRITLSSAAVTWIRSFLEDGTALKGMEMLLERMIAKNLSLAEVSSNAKVQDLEENVHLECIRCLRVILNTQPGFHDVLKHPAIIQCIAFSINTSSDKLRNIVAEVLAAICVLSKDGHRQVLEAFSDFRLKFQEDFRFQYLLNSLHSPVSTEGISAIAAHDFKTTCLSFINAIVNTPEALDERMLLREEFRRRGLREIFTDLRENYPQESLSKQIECYEEETEADVNEMKEQILIEILESDRLDPLLGLAENIRLLHSESGLRTVSKEIVAYTNNLLSVDVDDETRYEVLNLNSKFLQFSSRFIETEDWAITFFDFFKEIRESIGLSLRDILDKDPKFKTEMLHYHSLQDSNSELQKKLELSDQQLLKIKAIPMVSYILNQSSGDVDLTKTHKDNFTSMVQRLIQKEKDIASLQEKIDQLKSSKSSTSPLQEKSQESSWTAFKQELDIQKQENKDLSEMADSRSKEIAYLKRSLEAVCTRFQLTVNELVPENIDLNPPHSSEPSDLISIPDLQILQAELDAANKELLTKQKLENENVILNNTIAELKHQLQLKSQEKSHPSIQDLSNAKEPRISIHYQPLLSHGTSDLHAITPKESIARTTAIIPPPPPPPHMLKSPKQITSIPPPPPPTKSAVMIPPPPPYPSTRIPLPPPPPPPKQLSGIPPPPPPPQTKSQAPPPPPPPPMLAGMKSTGVTKGTTENQFTHSSSVQASNAHSNVHDPNLNAHLKSLSATSLNEILKPKIPMKALFWKKIPNSKIPNTLWESPVELNISDYLDHEELDVLFCKKVAKKPGSGYTSIGRRIKGKTSITLIDLNRANNIAITLARMKMPFSAIKLAILEINDSRLSMDNLRSLESNAPTKEEIKIVKSYTGLVDNLGTAEKYILQIMDIPRLSERLSCMIFRRRFNADIEELLPELQVMTQITSELRKSKRLKTLLEVALALGNYLNADTPRGDAKGFKFEGLKLLKDVKANPKTDGIPLSSLLHYLAWILEENWNDVFKIRDEFPSLEAAARVSVTTLTNNIYSLSQGVKQVNFELRAHKKLISLPENDQFILTMEAFVIKASRAAFEVKESGDKLERNLEEMLTYFGEDSSTKPEDFLNFIIGFLDSLENARVENAKLKEKAAQKVLNHTKKFSQSPSEKLSSFGQGDFDVAVRELRSGLRRKRTERPRSQIFSSSVRPQGTDTSVTSPIDKS
ncbi:hypothetical protein DSO57_1006241 [Entomophthora muscae]|uniref:Uncharacterized protein n=1 Tax=Entomophthora muscae TaxID=34485 RepID=A0ACC2TUM9_9FUNG|nr:hypothetical protein DSO57_1006241 [Entomophthora muscae]